MTSSYILFKFHTILSQLKNRIEPCTGQNARNKQSIKNGNYIKCRGSLKSDKNHFLESFFYVSYSDNVI